ncbi:MAG: Multidrug resistance protein, partial [Pseudomonas sp.]|nr:Multidrug resistance protein [Pseudomonas sp.]
MLTALKQYPSSVILLLSSSLLLSLGRAITLPYLVVYLSSGFNLGINDIGLMIGGSLIIGSLLSVYGGYLTDRFSSYPLILCFTVCFVAGFVGMCLTSSMWLFFCFLVTFNFAYSVTDV